MTVGLAEPDPGWPDRAAALSGELVGLLGPALVTCHHIGSTAVPGLAAKPVIDLLCEVTDLASLAARRPMLAAAGYDWLGAFGLPRRRYLRRDRADGRREVQVHCYATGDPEVRRHLAFRDFLRRDAGARADYAATKRRCAATCPDSEAYGACKGPLIRRLEAAALSR